jgi:hypothetical protein
VRGALRRLATASIPSPSLLLHRVGVEANDDASVAGRIEEDFACDLSVADREERRLFHHETLT